MHDMTEIPLWVASLPHDDDFYADRMLMVSFRDSRVSESFDAVIGDFVFPPESGVEKLDFEGLSHLDKDHSRHIAERERQANPLTQTDMLGDFCYTVRFRGDFGETKRDGSP